jgi:toxin YoeB
MNYQLDFTKQAIEDIAYFKTSGNTFFLKKLLKLFEELIENPYEGSGKPEKLKYNLSGNWSRRINKEHRLIYEVLGNKVLIHSVKGHY